MLRKRKPDSETRLRRLPPGGPVVAAGLAGAGGGLLVLDAPAGLAWALILTAAAAARQRRPGKRARPK
jgi:hypothetical protein